MLMVVLVLDQELELSEGMLLGNMVVLGKRKPVGLLLMVLLLKRVLQRALNPLLALTLLLAYMLLVLLLGQLLVHIMQSTLLIHQ